MTAAVDLITALVARALAPLAAGEAPSMAQPAGELLSPQARAAAGFTAPGVTFAYPTDDHGPLVADYGAEVATLRSATAPGNAVRAAVEAAMRAWPQDVTAGSCPDAETPGRQVCELLVRFNEHRYVRVAIHHPRGSAEEPPGVEVRVAGLKAIGLRTPPPP